MASNLPLLEEAAAKLKHLLPEVVFVGGSTLDLIVTDQGSAPIRSTYDVDVIVAADYADYSAFCDRLRDIGFDNDTRPDAPLCRFLHGGLMLDVMSTYTNTPRYKGSGRPSIQKGHGAANVVIGTFYLSTNLLAYTARF